MKRIIVLAVSVLLVSCVTATQSYKQSDEISKNDYSNIKDYGVVLLSVNWGRRWNCGGFENAELTSIGFDHLPIQNTNDEASPTLVLNSPSRITNKPVFTNYAFRIKPGEYALSFINIKAARSVSDVGYFTAKRSSLIPSGEIKGGSFTVKSGEVVYIGNLWLDCAYTPVLWRYYSEGRNEFNKHLNEFSEKYPYIDLKNVQYRLLKTKVFGNEYKLH